MTENKPDIASGWVDPDEAPELTSDWFDKADAYRVGTLIRRGRPVSDNPKQLISIRLDRDILDRFRAGGAGWQSRINEALRKAAG